MIAQNNKDLGYLNARLRESVKIYNLSQNVFEFLNIAIAALGDDFIFKPRNKFDKLSNENKISHPLLNMLFNEKIPDPGLIELCEIGLYLKEFSYDENISYVIDSLKHDAQYRSTYFQLALAFRIHKMDCSVSLEPQTLRGKSDLQFNFESKTYIAECYRLNYTMNSRNNKIDSIFCQKLFDFIPDNKILSIKIRFSESLSQHSFLRRSKEIEQVFNHFISENKENQKIDFPEFEIEIDNITFNGSDPDFVFDNQGKMSWPRYKNCVDCMTSQIQSRGQIFKKIENGPEIKRKQSRIFIWFPEYEDDKSPYDILESKIARKIKQTKTINQDFGRILFVEFPYGLNVDDYKRHSKISRNSSRNFDNLSGIFLMERRINGKNRFQYQGLLLDGASNNPIPRSFLSRINVIELGDIFKYHE